MPKDAFRAIPLQVHGVLAGVPLHDVTVTDLAGGGPGRTVADVRALLTARSGSKAGPATRALFAFRKMLGKLFGWDKLPEVLADASYASRIPPAIARRSSVVPGTRDGAFLTLYELEHESLHEARNATVHGFLAFALEPTDAGYRLYWAVYVKPVTWFTPIYMALIEPFRRFIVYPSLLRSISRAWAQRYAAETLV
jgi:hypothetical protein